jgi:Cof subfamily protein (haloacid dehalogenase superfamily)
MLTKPDIKLIVSDLDGTLLGDKSLMSGFTSDTLKEVQRVGVVFAACTGRFPENAAMVMAEAGIVCPIISLNGSCIELAPLGDRIYEKTMSKKSAREVFETLEGLGEGYFIFAPGAVISRYEGNSHHSELDVRKSAFQSASVRFSYGLKASLEALEEPVYKFYVYFTEKSKPREAIRAALGGIAGASLTQSSNSNLEVVTDEADKGTGTRILAERLNIRPENIMALGDQLNDLPMLRSAGLKVAMGNAEEPLKQIADYIAQDNTQDGAAKAIRRFCLP